MNEAAPNKEPASFEQRLREAILASGAALKSKIIPAAARGQAIDRALKSGLPELRNDAWRYADLSNLRHCGFDPANDSISSPEGSTPSIETANALPSARLAGFTRLVLLNGRLAKDQSDACELLDHRAAPMLPERTGHERFGWLNDAFALDVLRLKVTGEHRLEIVQLNTVPQSGSAAYPRLEIEVTENAKLTIVERQLGSLGAGKHLNVAAQVVAGRGSKVQHLRWQSLANDCELIETLQIAIDADAHYQLQQLSLGSATARLSVRAALFGKGAELHVSGLGCAFDGRKLDHSLRIDHLAPHTVNTQKLKFAASNGSRASGSSRVEVAAVAKDSRSEQSLRGLLTDTRAEVNLRPVLQIFTDEVRANHGATTGALDAQALHYLRSRGLPEGEAQALLTRAFFVDSLTSIEALPLRLAAQQLLDATLAAAPLANSPLAASPLAQPSV